MTYKSYQELCRLLTFEERFEYLKLNGMSKKTAGFERYLNQKFYHSYEWKHVRRNVIIRDNGCDLAIKDRLIYGRIIVHHINPISIEEINNRAFSIFDLNNLVCTSQDTSNAIHYGDSSLLLQISIDRKKGDTHLWKVY